MMFLCWLFRGNDFDRNKVMTYRPEHVRTLAAMLPYNSSFFTIEPGTHHHVWDTFSVPVAEQASKGYPKWCGDQGWIAHVLGPDEPVYCEDDEVIVRYRRRVVAPPPATARAIFTCGPYRPDTLIDLEWVRADYHD